MLLLKKISMNMNTRVFHKKKIFIYYSKLTILMNPSNFLEIQHNMVAPEKYFVLFLNFLFIIIKNRFFFLPAIPIHFQNFFLKWLSQYTILIIPSMTKFIDKIFFVIFFKHLNHSRIYLFVCFCLFI
jgi:hypothetical protein